MLFTSFYSRFPEIAKKETRVVTIKSAQFNLPLGEFALIDSYCEDDACDCRKVMINFVIAKNPNKILSTIGYGWESLAFYTKWAYGDTRLAKTMKGTYLELGGIQTKYATNFLRLFNNVCLDSIYKKRIKKHYYQFKRFGVLN